MNWQDLVDRPAREHFVQVYQDAEFLAEAVTRYLQAGLDAGEAGLVIARPEHRARFALRGAVTMLDAEETLGKFMANGMPQWAPFRELVGGLIAAQGRPVRAYGEMVDLLWQRGERFQLHLIGLANPKTGGAALARLRALQAGGRPIRYEGPVGDAKVDEAYAACTFSVYPSLMEGFGLPVIESLAHGKPCICSARGAIGESAREGADA